MAKIAEAEVYVVPKFPGFKKAVEAELAKINPEGVGKKHGDGYTKGFSGGLVKSGAAIGVFSAVASKAMASIGNHLGDAIRRFDTLNNYPKVMQSLGYSAKDADASISKMSDRLQTLPTTLDSMVSLVQGISVATGDLSIATDAGLALNDMLVASGSNAQLTGAAMEQFRQILSKGKPELQDWKSLTQAMPGQMDQLAKSMLGPEASANDLYAALGGGGAEATVTMDELLQAMIRLDAEGGEGFASFKEQAETAAGGVQTSMANMGNAITKGIAGIMEEVGSDRISGAFNDAKVGINEAFGVARAGASAAMPLLDGVYGVVKEIGPEAIAAAAAFSAFQGVSTRITDAKGRLSSLSKEASALTKVNAALGTSFTPIGIGFGIASVAVVAGASAYMSYMEKAENARMATEGFAEAVAKTTALDEYRGRLDGVGEAAKSTAMTSEELNASFAQSAERIAETAAQAEAQLGSLDNAQSIIEQYAGKTDLSADAQGRLEWALKQVNDQFGLNVTASDVAADKYVDAEGKTRKLTDAINELVDAKKQEIRMAALSASYEEAYGKQQEAAQSLASLKANKDTWVNNKSLELQASSPWITSDQADAAALAAYNEELAKVSGLSQEAGKNLASIEEEMGDTAKSASESADEVDKLCNAMDRSTGQEFSQTFKERGTSMAAFKEDLRGLGADVEDLSRLSGDQMVELASVYDGTTSSIVGKLDELGVGMDEAAKKAAESVDEIVKTIEGMGISDALSSAGVDVRAFAQSLADAGVSAGDLVGIDIGGMAERFNGDVNSMTWAIKNYNKVPLKDKDGNVDVNDAELLDAQGNVWTWNGTKLASKSASAKVSGNAANGSATDALVSTRNAIAKLYSKTISVNVNGNYNRAFSVIAAGVSSVNDLMSKTVNAAISKRAAGGIRPHADGGVRLHASGAIATSAVPLDIVGEDGAEAIVPLTNRRYSQPFVDLIADGVNEKGDNRDLIEAIMVLHRDLAAIMDAIPMGSSARDEARRARKAVRYAQ